MAQRFDLSGNNKEVRVWVYFMLPIAVLTLVLFAIFDATSPLYPVALFIPFVSGLSYRWWRTTYRKKSATSAYKKH